MSENPPKFYEPGFRQNLEELDIDALEIKGSIPSWLSGSLLRNGPGMVHADKPTQHWFDGLAMLHKFDIKGGKISYKSKYVDCEAYRKTSETGKIAYSDFATDPCRSLFGKIQTVFSSNAKITDSAKVSVGKIGDKLMAMGEPLMQIQIDPDTLESLGVYHFDKDPNSRMTTAHPHSDKDESYNLVVEYGPINYYTIFSISKETKKIASIPVREPAYLHSFGMSDRYFIIAEFPLVVQSLKFVFRLRPFIENFKWKENNGTKFIIIDRVKGEVVARIKTDAFFSFHHVNAFEVGNELVVDLATYENADVIQNYYMSQLADQAQKLPYGRMERFVLNVEEKKLVSRKIISEECIELPHYDVAGFKSNPEYQFVYGCGINNEHHEGFYNQLVKIDLNSGESKIWFQKDNYPGEPIFVPNPDRKSEDDGLLLSVVLNADQKHSFLLILEARTMEEVGRAELPHSILFGYHGAFIND